MFRTLSVLFVAATATFLTSCATVIQGTNEEVTVETTPPGATATVDGSHSATTPCKFNLERDEDHFIEIKKDGYKTVHVKVESELGGAVFGNLLLGGIIGGIVDASNGAAMTLDPDEIDIQLVRGHGTVEWVDPEGDTSDIPGNPNPKNPE